MGQKVHPIGFRVGVYRDWLSRWFARDTYGKQLLEDIKIRRYLNGALESAEVSKVEIEKAGDNVRVIIFSGRPGMVIGKKGQEIDQLRTQLGRILGSKKSIEISVQEVKSPELDAMLVAKNIADQLTGRASYKKAMKRAAISAMRSGAKGIKVCCAGRLQGAEIARTEWTRVGSIPLHTLRSDVDYGFAEAKTTYGIIGVKVWICKGEFQHA
ncbi:MAG TPA: 30S ribosomal protein S3 [Candidatus Limnocylindria bacterium]|nr:30S ribosomal protein S3 [Candidatus Limnocylindria bacterium]